MGRIEKRLKERMRRDKQSRACEDKSEEMSADRRATKKMITRKNAKELE
jgi:hypothetical protein